MMPSSAWYDCLMVDPPPHVSSEDNARFMYQVVAFVANMPRPGEHVYGGASGWYPHVAVKRRFAASDETKMLAEVEAIANATPVFSIQFRELIPAGVLPVDIVTADRSDTLQKLHERLFYTVGRSKYPDRELDNFSPHMTVSWHGKSVVFAQRFIQTLWPVEAISVIKDSGDDSRLIDAFPLLGKG